MAAWVKGGATDADAAVEAAAALLSSARAPVFAGLNAEVAAIRAAYDLAGRIGASVDSAGGEATYADLGALARVGAMQAPPAEVVGRADAVLLVGEAPGRSPLVERLRATKPVRGRAAGAERRVLSLPGTGDLAVRLAHLRAHARGHMTSDAELSETARALSAALYGAVLYDPGELGTLGIEMLQGLVMDLNEATRCFALSLGDGTQDRAALQVAAWTTGQATRVGFGRRVPEQDPWRFDAARQVEAGEADVALWLASLPTARPDWLKTLPAVALVGGEASPDIAEVVIRVGEPGRETGGVLWNEGRAGLSYRAPEQAGDLPSAAEIIVRIAAAVAGRNALASRAPANRKDS
ncbi:formyltransferase [Methylobacterium radiodurans]|uniref:Formyltransferase n=1 Tax=Methylobacterium radiodurans TaxID=2202828 RepID=A0A2U8VUJ5_9HYPH|nr:formyltransferase [Methylobacterium radiodurans]AWN37454.1 formyltransferase [Methylobacterium radiodurans]